MMMNNTCRPSKFQDLKSFDMKIIKGIKWAEDMFETLDSGFKKSFLNWIAVVLALSQNETDVKEWMATYVEQFEERCCEMVSDIQDLHEQVIVNIEDYLNKTQVLCKTLQIEMPVLGKQKLGLYQEQLQLKKRIQEFEQMVSTRESELSELRHKQLKLCTALGKEPMVLKTNPLPSSADVVELQKYIEQLDQEKFNREETFYSIKEKIVELVNELQYDPCTKFERDIIYDDGLKFAVTETNMRALQNFHANLLKESDNVKEEICQLSHKIEQLWTLLDVEFLEREEFRKTHTGNSLKNLEALRTELQRCQQLKKANIKVFVDKLRQELTEIWEQCHCSESIRNEFRYFYSDCYTEDLMELHEVQLEKWRTYAQENKEILSLLNKHKTLWLKMLELEESANGPDRFNNRGGKLLKEEKERNLLVKQIPKIEETLLEHAEKYEFRYGVPFLTYGHSVSEYIDNLHCDRENDKKIKLSARKAQKAPLSTTKSVLVPSSSHMISRRQCPATDGKKTVRTTPRIVVTDPRKAKQTSNIAASSRTIGRAKRLSFERKKRIEKIRRISRQLDSKNNSTYVEFQNDLSERTDLRSTMNLPNINDERTFRHELLAVPGPSGTSNFIKTPTKPPPKTPKSATKSPGYSSKLTAAKSTKKLLF